MAGSDNSRQTNDSRDESFFEIHKQRDKRYRNDSSLKEDTNNYKADKKN